MTHKVYVVVASLSLALGCNMMDHDDANKADKKMATTQPSHAMHHGAMSMNEPMIEHAVAVLHPTKGNEAHGTIQFHQMGNSLHVMGDIEDLPPKSKHGFHIHQYGDCSDPMGKSAGDHYDPMATKHHGMPNDAIGSRHAGDMGNIEADDSGKAHVDVTLSDVSLTATNPVIGRAVIVHAKEDNGGQPTGNAGDRIACGVIGAAK